MPVAQLVNVLAQALGGEQSPEKSARLSLGCAGDGFAFPLTPDSGFSSQRSISALLSLHRFAFYCLDVNFSACSATAMEVKEPLPFGSPWVAPV